MKYGYARVSKDDQDLALQVSAMLNDGIIMENILTDQMSGKSRARPGLEELLKKVVTGDSITVWKLDRLGRSVRDLVNITHEIEGSGVSLISIMDKFDTSTPSGRFFFHVLGAVAEFERAVIIQRVNAGLDVARSKGVKLGPKYKYSEDEISRAVKLWKNGGSLREVEELTGISKSTVSRYDKLTAAEV